MDRLPLAVTLVSIVIAFVLWLIAYSLESDSRWFPEQSDTQEQPEWLSLAEDTPLRTSGTAGDCMQTEEDLRASVEQARACNSDADCTLFDYGYPIQCMTSIVKSEITALRLAYRNYERHCEFRVYYDCPTGEMEREPVCRNNRCAVELTGNDVLNEETLDYLGIEP